MKLTILGCYSATPRSFGNPTSQVLEIGNQMFLIDCAEGTQVQLRRHKIKFSKINHIFISHLHGDHFYGLIGLISTFMLLNRTNDLHIYGPKGIKEIILLQLKYSKSYTNYGLYFHELTSNSSEILFENETVVVSTIPLEHRVYTNGFLFKQKPGNRKINTKAIEEYKISPAYFHKLKSGDNLQLENGTILPNDLLTFAPAKVYSYAFCSDTKYTEKIIPLIENVNVLYHESTFLEQDIEKAAPTMHSTAKQAATIAFKSNVGLLLLGHYSTRYQDLSLFENQAKEIFDNVKLTQDGEVFTF